LNSASHGEANFFRSSSPPAYPEAIKTSPTSIFDSGLGLIHLSPLLIARTYMPVSLNVLRKTFEFTMLLIGIMPPFEK